MIQQEFRGDDPRIEIPVCLKRVCWFTQKKTGTVHAYIELVYG